MTLRQGQQRKALGHAAGAAWRGGNTALRQRRTIRAPPMKRLSRSISTSRISSGISLSFVAGKRGASGRMPDAPDGDLKSEQCRESGYSTNTNTGWDGMPFATTSNLLGPGSWLAGTSKRVDTGANDATAMLL